MVKNAIGIIGGLFLLVVVTTGRAAAQKRVVFSYGYSGLTTAEGAENAADAAMAGLKGAEPKVVFVVFKEGEVRDCPAALAAIATVFDTSIIYGTRTVSDANAILTMNGRTDKIVVIAMGGEVSCASASGSPRNVGSGADQTACGIAIGDSLRAAINAIPADKGKFIVLYGDCHVDMDDYLTKGLVSSLTDKKFPVVGNASIWVMERGKIYEAGKNMGLLIWGDFTVHCGMAFDHEGSNDADAIVRKAHTALIRAGVDTMKTPSDFCLINNCRGRFGTLSGKAGYAKLEADTIRHTLGMTVPVVGIYGSGEIGKMTDTSTAVGDGNSISVLTVTARVSTAALPMKDLRGARLSRPNGSGRNGCYTIDGRLRDYPTGGYHYGTGIVVQHGEYISYKRSATVHIFVR